MCEMSNDKEHIRGGSRNEEDYANSLVRNKELGNNNHALNKKNQGQEEQIENLMKELNSLVLCAVNLNQMIGVLYQHGKTSTGKVGDNDAEGDSDAGYVAKDRIAFIQNLIMVQDETVKRRLLELIDEKKKSVSFLLAFCEKIIDSPLHGIIDDINGVQDCVHEKCQKLQGADKDALISHAVEQCVSLDKIAEIMGVGLEPQSSWDGKISRIQKFLNGVDTLNTEINDEQLNNIAVTEKVDAVCDEKSTEKASKCYDRWDSLVRENIKLLKSELTLDYEKYDSIYHQLLKTFRGTVESIIGKMDVDSPFKPLFELLVDGARKNSGVVACLHRYELGKEHVASGESAAFKNGVEGMKKYYSEYLENDFVPVLDEFVKIYLYSRIELPGFNVRELFTGDNIDIDSINILFLYVNLQLKSAFDMELKAAELCTDYYDARFHECVGWANLAMLCPEYNAQIYKMDPDRIYDLHSVGIISKTLNINKKAIIVKKT